MPVLLMVAPTWGLFGTNGRSLAQKFLEPGLYIAIDLVNRSLAIDPDETQVHRQGLTGDASGERCISRHPILPGNMRVCAFTKNLLNPRAALSIYAALKLLSWDDPDRLVHAR